MGDIYLRIQGENDSSIIAAKKVYIRANEAGHPIKRAKQIWIRPGKELLDAWEDNPAQFLIDHPDDNPNVNDNYWNWKPVWSMAINYHFSDSNIQTVYVTQGTAIGSLLTGPTKTETISGASVTRSFYAWTRTAGLESSIVDENYVVNSSIDLYPLYDYVVTFKNGSEIFERRVVKRHEMLGEVPVVEGVNDEHRVWMFRVNNNYIKYYDANTPITSDVVIIPATDLEVVFDLNGSGEISNSDKFYVSTIYGEDTWGDLIDNAPVPNAEGYGANYTTNEEYDFFHTGKIFLGWYTKKEGGTKITEKNRTTARTDKVFYAHWKDNISYDLYGLTPDGQQKYGKATLFDERYGDCSSIKFTLSHYVDGNHSNYCIQSIPKTNFFADDFSYIPLFYVDESQASGEFGEPWYYKWEGILDEPQIQVEASATNLYQAANGRYYRYKVEKTRSAYWLTINLKEGVSSSSNITNLNKNDFVWDANTNFDKMFDFAAGQVKILSSYNSTNGIGKYIPYFNDNGNLIDRDTKWETNYDNISSYGLKLYFSSLKRSLGGLCWWKWSTRDSDSSGYSLISNDTSTTRLDATWRTMWVTTSLSLPNGDNETWSWQVQNHAHKTGESKTQCAALHGIFPHHYKVEGIQRSNGETVTIASNIPNTTLDANSTTGAASYAINNLINYSDLILTAYDENNKFYNSFAQKIRNYIISYKYYTSPSATSMTTVADQSYLISNYIPIKSPINSYQYYSNSNGEQTRVFDHWTYNSSSYYPNNYFVGSNISRDTEVQFVASYVPKYLIDDSALSLTANSLTNTLTWTEIYDYNDSIEKAAWYKVVGIDSNDQEIVLSDISGYTNGFIPASAANEGEFTLTNNLFTYDIQKIKITAYNSDKTFYNSYTKTFTWYLLHFNATSYGQNLSQANIWRLYKEPIGTLPTLESSRNGWSFNGWEVQRYNQYSDTITHTTITENSILSDLPVYMSGSDRQAYPLWEQSAVTVTYSYIDSNGAAATFTELVAPTNSYYVSEPIDAYYTNSSGQTQLFKNWKRNNVAINSSEPQVISDDTTFVAEYQNYFDLSSIDFSYTGDGFFDWETVHDNSSDYNAAETYEIRGYNSTTSQWDTLITTSTTSGRSYTFANQSKYTKLRFYAIDHTEECMNYQEFNLTWYNLSTYDYNNILLEQKYWLEGDYVSMEGQDYLENQSPYQLTENATAPYYEDTYTGYRNTTKNTNVVFEEGYFDPTYIVRSSDFTNRAATFKQQVTTSTFLDTPVIQSANYDTKIVTWTSTYGEYYTLQKNGNKDATQASEPFQDYGGINGGQNLWEIEDIYDTEQEFDNQFFLYRVRVIAHRQHENGVTYEVYSNWTETTNHPTGEIYGVKWSDFSSMQGTRTDRAANFSNPVPYVSGASNYSSPFDNIMPWSGMQIVEDSTAGTLVSIPKFWYRLTQNDDSVWIQISPTERSDFHVSPAHMDRGDGYGERDVVYIGRYHCNQTNFKSESGLKPVWSSQHSLKNGRQKMADFGTEYRIADFALRFTIWLLYLVEFANWDSQATIGIGGSSGNVGNNSVVNMGYTDSMPYHTGTMKTSRSTLGPSIQYRYIEGLWENCVDVMEGIYIANASIYLTFDYDNDIGSGNQEYFVTSNIPSSAGYPTKLQVIDIPNAFPIFYQNGMSTNYSATTFPDLWRISTLTLMSLSSGGGYYYKGGTRNGLLSINPGLGIGKWNESYQDESYRLMKLPSS